MTAKPTLTTSAGAPISGDTDRFIVERQLGHLEKVHPDYAAGVRAALNRKP